MSEITPEQQIALDIARELIKAGVPVFAAPPNHGKGSEFLLPNDWQMKRPDLRTLSRWRPGWALCLITGHAVDALDTDPRNGGDESRNAAIERGEWPTVYGRSLTPSGGIHEIIAPTGQNKGTPWPGVDLQSGNRQGQGRALLYIAPTVRVAVAGPRAGEPVMYRWDVVPTVGSIPSDDPSIHGVINAIQGKRGARKAARSKAGRVQPADDDPFDPANDAWTVQSADKAIAEQLAAVKAAKAGDVNSTLGGAARLLGRFVAGGYLDQGEAEKRLLAALRAGRVHSDRWNRENGREWTAATVIAAGLANGAEEPWDVDRGWTAGVTAETTPLGEVVDTSSVSNSATLSELPASLGEIGGAEKSDVSNPLDSGKPEREKKSDVSAQNDAGPALELAPPGLPMEVARQLVNLYPAPITWWRGDFYQWTGAHWISQDAAEVRKWLYLTTERATYAKKKAGKDGAPDTYEILSWAPTIAKVREVSAALGEGVLQRIGDDEKVLALENGVLTGLQGERVLTKHSPKVFNLASRPFKYDPEARAPYWAKFLEEVLPDAPDDIAFLQEWFGYVLSGRTNIHVIASLAGESRSGKGTILRVLTGMTGSENVAAGRLDSIAGHFGLEPLIGKSLLTFGDIRWSNSNAQIAIQRMLEISGEDRITVPRKNKTDWQGTLGARIIFAGNEVPRFNDPARAMANRLRIVHFRQSFVGREDHGLTGKLLSELSGIFNWALAGLDRLTTLGRFTESARSADLRARVGDGSNPLASFAEEYLEAEADSWCLEDSVVEAYEEWCRRTRRTRDTSTAETIRSGLLDLFPGASNDKHTRRSKWVNGGPRRVRAFQGLRLATSNQEAFDNEGD